MAHEPLTAMQRLVTVVGLYLTQPDLICTHILMNIIKWVLYVQLCSLINPLTTDAGKRHHRQILAACYQLVQSILKIGSALAERVGQGEVPDSAWWQLQLPVEKPYNWSVMGGPFVCFLAQTGVKKHSFYLVGTPFLAI